MVNRVFGGIIDDDSDTVSDTTLVNSDTLGEAEILSTPASSVLRSPGSSLGYSSTSPGEKTFRDILLDDAGESPIVCSEDRRAIKAGSDPVLERRTAFLIAYRHLLEPLLSNDKSFGDLAVSKPLHGLEFETFAPVQHPLGVRAVLRPHQLESLALFVHWNRKGINGILADEMGLGKTLQILALFQFLKENDMLSEDTGLFLVVCPLSVLKNWNNEAKKYTPSLKVMDYYGTADIRALKRRSIRKGDGIDVVITTYETLSADSLSRLPKWHYVVLDEGHKIKNFDSQSATAVQKLRADHKILLTGTPLQNDLKELWSIFSWLYPEVFTPDTSTLFKEAFCLTEGKVEIGFLEHVKRFLDIIMLRRTKGSHSIGLPIPSKTEVTLLLPLSGLQKECYHNILNVMDNSLLEEVAARISKPVSHPNCESEMPQPSSLGKEQDGNSATSMEGVHTENKRQLLKGNVHQALNILMELRKCCVHPYLLDDIAPDPYELGDHLILASTKFIVLKRLIDQLVIANNRKMLIFSGFEHALNCCEDLLNMLSDTQKLFRFVRLDGSTSRARRNLNIYLFNEFPDYSVFLLSVRAGGEGINLSSASEVVFLDIDWNPQVTIQAESRAHRIGQTKPVTVYKLINRGTVEEQMLSRVAKKLFLASMLTEVKDAEACAGEDMSNPPLSPVSLLASSMRGHLMTEPTNTIVEEITTWSFDQIISTFQAANFVDNRTPDPAIAAKFGQRWLNRLERIDVNMFQGIKLPPSPRHKDTSDDIEILDRAERRVGKNRTVMMHGFAIDKQSLLCKDGEAVPTLSTGRPERERKQKSPILHQKFCFVCNQGAPLEACTFCPSAFHKKCIPATLRVDSPLMNRPICSHHRCSTCSKTASQSGLLFCCRLCSVASCEDCLPWDKTTFVGDEIPEYADLNFPSSVRYFYIECPDCSSSRFKRAHDFSGKESYCKRLRSSRKE